MVKAESTKTVTRILFLVEEGGGGVILASAILKHFKGATSRYFESFLQRPKLWLKCWET